MATTPQDRASARRAREDEAIRLRIKEIVAAAPPLTERQIARLAVLLNPPAQMRRTA